jgi:16S rRNA C967 or C1407 C5-methylase (RsmB/RsmF family)/NOL1/NOP2/fmu family ribosome biogenesis protein
VLPKAFTDAMKFRLGPEAELFFTEHETQAPVSVRVNPFKSVTKFDSQEHISWAKNGRYLPERISFTFDPLFHAGCYYVQEASSMFLEQVFNAVAGSSNGIRVLDACAAPGGKSTHILSLLDQESLLVSNEVIPSRNKILSQNLSKWGCSNVVVTQNETEKFSALTGFFDVIIVDAPCSGEGLFRKDPEACNEWSPDAVNICARRQHQILDDLYPALKEGGYIIYSTCTYEESENEEQVAHMISTYGMELVDLPLFNNDMVKSSGGLRFYPHRIKGEGFFISALKKCEAEEEVKKRTKNSGKKETVKFPEGLLNNQTRFIPYSHEDELYAFPEEHYTSINLIQDHLFVRKAGVHVGTTKGKDFIPSQELALSMDVHPEVKRVNLEEPDAITYLQCGALQLPFSEKGWMLVTYEHFPLGWIKALGNRVNNYYPREWRILKQ